jgi:hypothetical protein
MMKIIHACQSKIKFIRCSPQANTCAYITAKKPVITDPIQKGIA